MTALRRFFGEYHPLIYSLLLGAVLLAIGDCIGVLFLPLYLVREHQLDPFLVGLVVGAGPLASTIGGFVAGTLSDFFGRRLVMLGSLYVSSLIFVGFAFTHEPDLLLLLIIVKGFSVSFFGPVAKALMGDLTEAKKRMRVFSLRYISVNIGYAAGPTLGAFFWITKLANPFLVTASIYLAYAIILHILMNYYGISRISAGEKEQISLKGAFQVIRRDLVLLYFVMGGVIGTIVHGNWSVTLQQYLEKAFSDGAILYATLLTVNSVGVILLQYPLTRWSEKRSTLFVITLGSCLMALGMFGFSLSSSWVLFILFMVLFTMGEILFIPAEYIMIDRITPNELRGMYYGAQNFTTIGSFLGPVIGGSLLSHYGGMAMFATMGLIALISILFFRHGKTIQSSSRWAKSVEQPM